MKINKVRYGDKRYRLEAKLLFYTSKDNPFEAKRALELLEFDINKKLLTSSTEVVKIDLKKLEILPF